MRLDRALRLTSMLVALSGVFALGLTFEAPLWLVVPAAALVASLASPGLNARLKLPQRAMTPLVMAAFVFSVLDFFYIGGSLVAAGADFMLLLLCIRALSLSTPKDHVQLYAASFFVLLASTGLSTEIYFIAPFGLFFVSVVWALMLLTIRDEAELVSARTSGFRFGRGFFGGTALLTACSFAVTFLIFFSIPRVGIGFMSKRAGGLLRTTGFSDTVDLGAMGEVKQDPSVVMRVAMPGTAAMPEHTMYWRGRTFDSYDGRSWHDTFRRKTTAYAASMGRIYLRPDRTPSRILEQEVALEPLDTATLFAVNPAYYIRADFGAVSVEPGGAMFLQYPPGRRLHYTVYSAPDAGGYRPDDLPAAEYLQLPDGMLTVSTVTAQAIAGASGARETADMIMAYLEKYQTYTLDPPRDQALSPIDDFLTGSRAGFCEHFATAMTLMLRSAGVHARVVAGFMGGEWNAYGGYIVVREQDAHTWVEAYVPGEGWEMFDPTPASSGGAARRKTAGWFTDVTDYLKFRWDRYVVYYNLRDQLVGVGWASDAYYGLRSGLSKAAKDLLRAPSGGKGAAGRLWGIALIAASLLGSAAVIYLLLRILGRKKAGRRLADVWFYEEAQRLLARNGYARASGKTPREFADSLPAGPGRPNEGMAFVTELYYRVRYGGKGLSKEEKEVVKKTLDSMRRGRHG